MAKRRMTAKQARYFGGRRKTRSSRSASPLRRTHRRGSSSGLGSAMNMILPAAAYGAVRGPVATMATPLSSKLPFGQYNDELAMAGISYAAVKWAPGFFKKMGMAGLIVEAASAASGATAGMITGTASNNSLFTGGY